MNPQQIGHWLEKISIEQLPGVVTVSTLLCLACLLITWLLRHRSASTTSGVWQATCSAILISVFVLALIPGVPLRSPSPAQRVDVTAVSGSTWQAMTAPVAQQVTVKDDDPAVNQALDVDLTTDESYCSTVGTVTSEEASGDAISVATSARKFRFAESLTAAWLLVLVVMLAGFLRSVIACRAIIEKSSRNIPSHIAEAAGMACLRLGISQVPQLHLSNEVLVPFTAGTLRPVVVLPKAAIEWSRDKLQMVMTHELAHIERRDVLWHWIGRLAICVAWFNPLVWWAARRGVLDRERACDDRVIDCGFCGPDYGQCLVEIAGAVSSRIMPLTAAVSMAEPPMKLRLQSILSAAADRRRESKSYRGFVMTVFIGLALLLGIIRPLATAPAANSTVSTQPPEAAIPAKPNQDSSKIPDTKTAQNIPPDNEMIELTQPVTGTITDEVGTPIAGAEVLIKLWNFQGETQQTRQNATIRTWQCTTDENGRYTVDVSDLGKQPSRFCIGVQKADKRGFTQGGSEFWPSLGSVAVLRIIELEAVKLSPGRKITGQILGSNENPIRAVVKAWARSTKSEQTWLSSGIGVGDDGNIEIDVPTNSDAELAIYAADHSPLFVSVLPDQSDVGEITLSPGKIISGRVLDLHNQPAKGVVVELKAQTYRLKGLLPTWSRVAVTDENGAFTLLPASGNCMIRVHETVLVYDRAGGFESVSGNRPPLVVPLALKLQPERSIEEIDLHESESHRITGTARWDDGEPVKDLEVTGSIRLENSHEDLATVLTDANGNYEMRLPRDSRASVRAIGAHRDGDKSVWYMAKGIAPAPFTGNNSQVVGVTMLTDDVADVDWELGPERNASNGTATSIQAEQAFAELEAEDRQQSEKYYAAMSPEERERLDPRNVMTAKYLAFEEQFRGERPAVQAAVHVLGGANSVADPGSVIGNAGVEMIERLIDHYMVHEDLIDTFRSLTPGGPPVPRPDDLLQMASGRSPYPVVRASALLTRAERAKEQLRYLHALPFLEQYAAGMKVASRLDPDETSAGASGRKAEAMQQRVNELKAIDENDLRGQAGEWLDTVEKEYADLIHPHAFEHTFGQDAKALRFAIDHVNVGQPAPQIEAKDVNGKVFRLSDHQGTVVVLMFHQDTYNKALNLPHQNLAEKFQGQPLELITIVATGKQREFVENAKAASYHGTLILEPSRGPYCANWGVTLFPTTWVVDKSGRLALWSKGGSGIRETIEKLLKE